MNKSSYTTQPFVGQPNVLSLIDFCKGLAVAWIFLFHYTSTWFGWQGVHIFIVISGFGLTYSCLKKTDNISWKQWFLRRAERILPAYWLVSLGGFLIMVLFYCLKGQNLAANVLKSAINVILGLLLLQNFSYKTMFNPPPSDPLWFIPLIIGCYLVFPWLYNLTVKHQTTKGYLLILLGVAAIEFIYRAISIYWLDGYPIGFENPLLGNLSLQPLKPLNNLPDTFLVPFQLQAPFGFFPARITEFLLGMLGASILIQNPQKFHNIFVNYKMALVGVLIWLAGYALVFMGFIQWIFADFFIALGLVLWVVNLAWIFQQRLSFLFLKMSQLGSWSYYIFLTHSTFLFLSWEIEAHLVVDNNLLTIIKIALVGLIIIGTWLASWLIMKFDKSRFPKLIIQKSIAIFLQ